jgi:prevent-host-death family protein
MQITLLEAENRLSELIGRVQAGEEVIIANRGEAVARLTAIAPAEVPPSGSARALLDWIASASPPTSGRRSATSIDADIAVERAAWD